MSVQAPEALRFGGFCIDLARGVLLDRGEPVKIGSRAFDLLTILAAARGAVVTKSELLARVWPDLVVEENNLQAQISGLRRVLGAQPDGQDWIRTVPGRGYRFAAPVEASPIGGDRPATIVQPRQQVSFCRTVDGVTLASAVSGQGAPVVRTGVWMTHLEHDWKIAIWSELLERLSSRARLIRYDQRGNGLSDWDIPPLRADDALLDLEAVVDSHRLGKMTLLGISQGAATAIAYAAKHPERVERLIIHGGFASGWRKSSDPERVARGEALLAMVRVGWGQDNPAFRQVFTSLATPGAGREAMDAYNELQRLSASPENAARLASLNGDADVRHLLPQVRCPTLVFHSQHDAWVPIEFGRALAVAIPGARFVALDSPNHILLPDEAAFDRFVSEILAFLPTP